MSSVLGSSIDERALRSLCPTKLIKNFICLGNVFLLNCLVKYVKELLGQSAKNHINLSLANSSESNTTYSNTHEKSSHLNRLKILQNKSYRTLSLFQHIVQFSPFPISLRNPLSKYPHFKIFLK